MKTIFPHGKQDICACIMKSCCLTIFLMLISTNSFAADLPYGTLQEEDCVKCHWFQLKKITAAGGRHATEVGCLECHPQHPPEGENTIAACVLCHEGQPHFQIEDCLQCHADPHKPLVSLQDPIKPARKECLSCHAEVGQQMLAATSRHAEFFCTHCHNHHGSSPSCLDCHEPHRSTQASADCLRCHPPHRPQQVVLAGWIPATFCHDCHTREGRDLAETNTNHGVINCVSCHKGPHRSSIPSCQECHGLPHDQLLHSKFRRCLNDCHGDAHRLISNR
jgi:hypothetical protein